MVRLVPIIHRKPPPEPDNPFSTETETQSSEDQPAKLYPKPPVIPLQYRQARRAHINIVGNQTSKSQTSKSTSSNESEIPTSSFSLFDYLQELALTESEFESSLKERGLELHKVAGDGNCLFRSVADQIYGDEEMHEHVRHCCLDYMAQEADFFKAYVIGNYNSYIENKRKLRVFGDHLELQALSELYNRPIEIHIPGKSVLRVGDSTIQVNESNVSSSDSQNENNEQQNNENIVPIVLSYHNGNHYNSIRDPSKPTLGLGLGWNTEPSPQEAVIKKAVEESLVSVAEGQILEQARLESIQDEYTEDSLTAAALMESERAAIESTMDITFDDNVVYEDEYEWDSGEDLEEAIRLSLLESQQDQAPTL